MTWLLALAAVAVALPLVAVFTRHLLWLIERRRASRLPWWQQ